MGTKGHFSKIFSRIFKFGCFSWYHAQIFDKWVLFTDAEFNAESIATNLKTKKFKNAKARMLFSDCTFWFRDQFDEIKVFNVFRKILDSWEILFKSVGSRKLAESDNKNFHYLNRKSFESRNR